MHGLNHDLRLTFVQMKGKNQEKPDTSPRRGITGFMMEVYLRKEVMLQWAAIAQGLFLSNL